MWPEVNSRIEMSDSAAHRLRLYIIGFSTGKASFVVVAPAIMIADVEPIFTQLGGRCTFGA